MNPPPQRFYMGYIKDKNAKGLHYLSMVQAVGPNQARERLLADWRNTAPQMIEDVQKGNITLVVRLSSVKKAIREAPSIPSQPVKTGFFDVFPRAKVRMEVKQPYLNKKNRGE